MEVIQVGSGEGRGRTEMHAKGSRRLCYEALHGLARGLNKSPECSCLCVYVERRRASCSFDWPTVNLNTPGAEDVAPQSALPHSHIWPPAPPHQSAKPTISLPCVAGEKKPYGPQRANRTAQPSAKIPNWNFSRDATSNLTSSTNPQQTKHHRHSKSSHLPTHAVEAFTNFRKDG